MLALATLLKLRVEHNIKDMIVPLFQLTHYFVINKLHFKDASKSNNNNNHWIVVVVVRGSVVGPSSLDREPVVIGSVVF